MRIQNDSVADVAVDGMVTVCDSFSDDVVPLPPSHIFHEPVRAGRPVLFVIGPDVPVQFTAPDSKPGFEQHVAAGAAGWWCRRSGRRTGPER